MSTTGWGPAEFLADMHAEETPAEKASRMARQAAERQDRQTAVEEAERQAAIESEREARLFRYAQLGIGGRSVGDIFDQASRTADEDAEYGEAQRTIARIERRRAQRAEQHRWEAEQLDAAQRQAAPSGDPVEAAVQRAHREFAELTRAAFSDAVTGRKPRARRPKGSGGVAVRSEMCVHCIEQGATDEEAFLLHSDPDSGIPVTSTREQAEQAEAAG